jgi:hypothetical protein
MNEVFSLKRFFNASKSEVLLHRKNILITAGAILGLMLIISIGSINSTGQWNMHLIFYPLILLIGGTVTSSMVFNDLHQWPKNMHYLMTPASMFEKWLVKLLFVTVFYIVMSALLYFLFSLLSIAITLPIFGRAHPIFNPFHPLIVKVAGLYFMIHSVFFFGSVYFKKYALVKTLLSITALSILIGLFAGLVMRIAFAGLFNEGSFALRVEGQMYDWEKGKKFFESLWLIAEVVSKFVLPPLFWVLSYFRLRESEA